MRLIDGDALLADIKQKKLFAKLDTSFTGMGKRDGLQDAIDSIKRAPTVDAVPVTRCKDCKYYTGYECQRSKVSNIRVITDENDYCSRAELRGKKNDR